MTDYYPLRWGDNYSVDDAQDMARQMWPDLYANGDNVNDEPRCLPGCYTTTGHGDRIRYTTHARGCPVWADQVRMDQESEREYERDLAVDMARLYQDERECE